MTALIILAAAVSVGLVVFAIVWWIGDTWILGSEVLDDGGN